MAGVVLEGGTLRAMFSAGVVDALLDKNIHFNYVIGVSAGISYGVSYASNQRGRNIEILRRYRNDPRYFSLRNIPKHKSLFDVDFLYDEVPNELDIFDRESLSNFDGEVISVATDALTAKPHYFDTKNMDKEMTILRASCAIPFYFPPIYIDGRRYFDGGLSDSIPIKKSISEGNKNNLVVLTQPRGYRKKLSNSYKLASFLFRKKYPEFSKLFLTRAKMYNDTIDYIEELEAKNPNTIVVLRPAYRLKSLESDISQIEQNYQHGYDLAIQNIEKIAQLVKE